MTSLKNGKSQTLPIQLELPLTHQTSNSLKQVEKAIQDMLDLTWKCVLAHISVRTTKELMGQHGKLIALGDGKAYIQVSTAAVRRIAQDKLSDIEAAFKKAFNTTIEVRLEEKHMQ